MKHSIQFKMLLAFSIVTFIGFSAFLLAAYKINEQNNSQIIHKDMIEARKTLDNYLKQYFLIKDTEMSKLSFATEATNIANVVSTQMGSQVTLYDAQGKNITSPLNKANLDNKDLSTALKGETAYTINHSEEKVMVTLSFPVKANDHVIGIMRYSKDYTEQSKYTNRFQNMIILFAVIIFMFIYITSLILSRKITNPIRKLTRSTEQLSAGDFVLHIDIDSKDEMGELAQRFKQMALRIKEQIEIIEMDRDALKEAQSQSKTFFDNVTHELKTPLTTILGYSQVLKDNGFTDRDFFEKGTSYIIKESQRLNHMVIDIIELSKATSDDISYYMEQVDLSPLIKETCDEMRMKGKKYGIRIHYEVEDNLTLVGDKDKLKEVIINLIDNAIKYGKVNSIIRVEGSHTGTMITLKVIDQGKGIPSEYITNLFEPFYRIPNIGVREKGSAGLGLAIVKSIVEKHGGTIEIDSKVNSGTEVKLSFKENPHA
ncbi:sensor histidine kinase [Neobacillus jeddahensis]|nr:HAMP domain-containing sensor histidine kinase [Neobacillus jeddahensis]